MKIPIILITGFLGAGKTTFVNRLTKHYRDKRFAILMNDFGEIPVDGSLLEDFGEEGSVYEIARGSIFCTCLTEGFITGLKYFIERRPEILFIETSGLSDPLGMDKFLKDVGLEKEFSLEQTVCLVDGIRGIGALSMIEAARKQVMAAHLLLINKCDIADEDSLLALETRVAEINPEAKTIRCANGNVDFSLINDRQSDGIRHPGDFESCNTPEDRPLSLILTPGEGWSLEKTVNLLDKISTNVFRIKGYISIDEKIYFVTDGGANIQAKEVSEIPESSREGIVVLGSRESKAKVIAVWENG